MALQAGGLPPEMLGPWVQRATPAVGDQKGNGEEVLVSREFVEALKSPKRNNLCVCSNRVSERKALK